MSFDIFALLETVPEVPRAPKVVDSNADVERITVLVAIVGVIVKEHVGVTPSELSLSW
jgi:hypothetical protein